MILISKNLSELVGKIITLCTDCNQYEFHNPSADYPNEYKTYDQAWEELFQSFDYLSDKLGQARYEQLLDMANQAKVHYESEQIHWASWLMQDIEQVVRGKPPFAYPEDMYRWPKIRLVK